MGGYGEVIGIAADGMRKTFCERRMRFHRGKGMFSRQCMKFGSTALLLIATLLVGGCGSTLYRATPEDTRDLSPAQARELLIRTAQGSYLGQTCTPVYSSRSTVSVSYRKMEAACPGNPRDKPGGSSFRFAENPALVAVLTSAVISTACINASGSTTGAYGKSDCTFYWGGETAHSAARDFVRAWHVLARAGTVDPAQEAAFERAAQSYRSAQVKPQLPEEAVKYKVQAELAVQQKRFDDAVDLYDQALNIAPWWSAGHYNRGLILGELQDYQGGIRALQKYLKLEPEASNARAVQLRIYQWESLLPRTAK